MKISPKENVTSWCRHYIFFVKAKRAGTKKPNLLTLPFFMFSDYVGPFSKPS
jgi:hypothetical protein